MKRVIFDTDIGIDDAMALVFLHCAREVELVAMVTGFGNASIDDTTRNALYVKERFGIAAPVYKGAAESSGESLFDSYPDFVHGRNGLGGLDVSGVTMLPESTAGAQAIVDIVRQNPQEITIVAVGRMTNLAAALALCPDLPELVGEVIVMGGAFGFNDHRGNVSPVAEANIAGDPSAANVVFTSGMPLTIVGLDVTHETIMTGDYFDDLKANTGAAGAFVYDVSRFYLDFHQKNTGRFASPVHDPSAVAFLLRPEIYTTREAVVQVVTEGVGIGQTIWADPETTYQTGNWNSLPSCRICTSVDTEAVLDLYAKTLGSGSTSD